MTTIPTRALLGLVALACWGFAAANEEASCLNRQKSGECETDPSAMRLSGCGCEIIEERAVHLGDSALLVARSGGDWARSPDFAVQLWYRPERKAKDDHEEQCLVSHGSWEGRFKLSVLPWRHLRFTVRDDGGGVMDCDGAHPLQPRRWYHVAVSYENGRASLAVNGIGAALACSRAHGGRANPTAKPLVVGACSAPGGRDHIRGTVSDFRYWPRAQPRPDLFGRRLPPDQGGVGWAAWATVGGAGPLPKTLSGDGSLEWEVQGEARWTALERGDQALSITLQGSNLKEAEGRIKRLHICAEYL